MKVTVEISKYPLNESFEQEVLGFIERLRQYRGLEISVGPLATLIHGEYSQVFSALEKEMAHSLSSRLNTVFLLKIAGGDRRYKS